MSHLEDLMLKIAALHRYEPISGGMSQEEDEMMFSQFLYKYIYIYFTQNKRMSGARCHVDICCYPCS